MDRDTALLLRREVGLLRARESRRVFDAELSVGTPAARRRTFPLDARDVPAVDPALRIDMVCSLLEDEELLEDGAPPGRAAWLVRPGQPDLHDLDLQWLSAANVAFGVHGVHLTGFFAITRAGWLDVRTGEHRVWRRLRL